MNYRKIGKSDLLVSEIGFGSMSLHEDTPESRKLIARAVEQGINYFDTADLYDAGKNEELLGEVLKPYRQKVIIATKVGNQLKADGSGWDWNPRKSYILSQVELSLKRLQTDYIDLYQLHGGTIDDPIDETIEAFELLKEQGKIRYYGISSIRPNVIREYVKRSAIVSVMMQYSLLDRRPEESCLDLLQENEISVLSRGGVAQGLLIDKPAKAYLNHIETEVKKATEFIQRLAAEYQANAAQIALAYVLHRPVVASAVTGIRTQKQLEDLVSKQVPQLNEADYSALQSVIAPNFYEQHR